MSNLTDSQRDLLAEFRREFIVVRDDIMAGIEKLRKEQRERQQRGEADAEIERLRQEVKRKD